MRVKQFSILIVDDSEDDLLLIKRAYRKNGTSDEIRTVLSGNEAIRYLNGEGEFADRRRFPYPTLVMTDLKMADGDGFHVLENMKNHPEWCVIPVLVLSSSEDLDDIKKSYELGASCYMSKPHSIEELQELLRRFHEFWAQCHVPITDISGKQPATSSEGKLGARFARAR